MVMIYIKIVELHSLMLHSKFQNHRPSGSRDEGFAFYSNGGHLGHVTMTIYLYKLSVLFLFHSPFLTTPYIKMDLIGQAVSEKMFENHGHIYVHSPGTGADNHLGTLIS